ncbi:MAG: glucose 1-dehydrogenase [Chloroflexi bacterium]|nr:glucose 1-dehydrogenase [Chloroflexota bacterium]MDA1147388.1 glucose 1-dehydrogenase [Chloroflexota bacterium]
MNEAARALFDLSGTVALVTGGNGGIGQGIADGLAEAGASVVIAARNEAKTAAAVAAIQSRGGAATGITCDVNVRADLEAAVARCESEYGRLDILVNNAGVARGGQAQSISEADWQLVIDTNLSSLLWAAQVAYPLLKSGGRGKVINIASEYSLFGSGRGIAYPSSKGGVVQLTKSLAVGWAVDGIQVNAIVPGWITTDMTAPVKDNQRFYEGIIYRTPAGRFGEPDELAGAGVFLASHAADFVTGVVLPVDGGYAAG